MAENTKTTQRLKELRAASVPELDVAVREAQKRIYQFHKDKVSKPIQDVKAVHNARKEIARALTIKRERELEAEAKS